MENLDKATAASQKYNNSDSSTDIEGADQI